MKDKAIILINVGTPDGPDVKSVRKYLTEFLNDARVIDIPWLLRKILVNLIIIPFRAKKSAALYKIMWAENGSPLLFHSENLSSKIGALMPGYEVITAMRYGNPSLKKILKNLESAQLSEIIFVPMYPQYASSTTGTVLEMIFDELKNWNVVPDIKIVSQFYNHPLFISSVASKIRNAGVEQFDHVVFSFHGLPMSHISKSHPSVEYSNCTCETTMPAHGEYCYKATCYETARLLAKECGIPRDLYTVAFQSRLNKNWLTPFTDKVLIEKAKSGVRNILIVSPAFVADCLETLVELEIENKKLFIENGGGNLVLVPGLNDSDEWAESLKNIIFESNK